MNSVANEDGRIGSKRTLPPKSFSKNAYVPSKTTLIMTGSERMGRFLIYPLTLTIPIFNNFQENFVKNPPTLKLLLVSIIFFIKFESF